MDWLQIILGFLGGGGLAWYIALRKLPGENQRMNVDAAAVASKALIDILNATQAERAAFAIERDNLTKRIDAMEAEQEIHRIARNQEIDELKARIQSDLMDTKELRAEHAEKEKRINKLEMMVVKQSEYIDAQNTLLKEAGIPVPLNGELLRSAHRLKLSIQEREQLKGKKPE